MSILQVSAFVENQPGRLKRLTDILEQAEVSIRGFSLADTADFGIARFVLDKPQAAIDALDSAGVLTKLTELLCIELPDETGALDTVIKIMAQGNINIEYAYSLVSTYVAMKVDDIDKAQRLLLEQFAVADKNQPQLRFVTDKDLQKHFADQ